MRKRNVVLVIIILGVIFAVGLSFWMQEKRKTKAKSNSAGIKYSAGAMALPSESPKNKEPGKLDIKLLFSSTPIEESIMYEVKPGDALFSIAKEFGTTVDLIKISNNLKNETIRIGQRLKIIKGEFKIVVNVSNNTLSLFLNDKIVKTYPVGTAKYRNTPLGEFKIINRIVEPTWYAPDGVYPYGDPKNIIGTRWMGINEPGYGIHGTSEPGSIGKYVSAGCIRMYNEDVEELFKIVPVGTKVNIIGG